MKQLDTMIKQLILYSLLLSISLNYGMQKEDQGSTLALFKAPQKVQNILDEAYAQTSGGPLPPESEISMNHYWQAHKGLILALQVDHLEHINSPWGKSNLTNHSHYHLHSVAITQLLFNRVKVRCIGFEGDLEEPKKFLSRKPAQPKFFEITQPIDLEMVRRSISEQHSRGELARYYSQVHKYIPATELATYIGSDRLVMCNDYNNRVLYEITHVDGESIDPVISPEIRIWRPYAEVEEEWNMLKARYNKER